MIPFYFYVQSFYAVHSASLKCDQSLLICALGASVKKSACYMRYTFRREKNLCSGLKQVRTADENCHILFVKKI